MPKKKSEIDWVKAFKPLFKQYEGRKHPLNHQNPYQLIVMIILSTRTTDRNVNQLAPAFFQKFPTLKSISKVTPEELHPYISKLTNFANKAIWLVELAKAVGDEKNLPKTIEELTALKGMGRKSANVFLSESGASMQGVIVDLHVLRTAPRIGVAEGTNPLHIEQQLMAALPQKYWRDLGMSLTYLGREICRPTEPHCQECVMNTYCEYYKSR